MTERKKRCMYCKRLTHDWEKEGGIVRCWDCGREARRQYAQILKERKNDKLLGNGDGAE